MLLSLLLSFHVDARIGLRHPFGVMSSDEFLEASLLGSSFLVSELGALSFGDEVPSGSSSLSEPELHLLDGDELSLQGRILFFGGGNLYTHASSDLALEHIDGYISSANLAFLSVLSS